MDIILIMILVAMSAFFSGSETSITSLSTIKLRQLVESEVKNSRKLEFLVDNSTRTISAILIGNNIVNILGSSIATVIFVNKFGNNGVAISTVVMTLLILTFGEIIPKNLAKTNSAKMALAVAPFIYLIVKILTPFTALFGVISKSVTNGEAEEKMTEDDLITILNVSHEEGILENEQKEMMENVFEIAGSQAKDVMTNRTSIVSIPGDSTYDEVLDLVKNNHFSRYPVIGENIDDIIGLLYVKDLLYVSKENFQLKDHLRQAIFQYESRPNFLLLSELKKNKMSMAVILDEYGGTAGIVTIEDIVEEIVGDIDDEYDESNNSIKQLRENIYVLEAETDLDDINEKLGTNLQSDEYESIGGFVIGLAGKFPKVGEVYKFENYEFTIEKASPYKLERLKMRIERWFDVYTFTFAHRIFTIRWCD